MAGLVLSGSSARAQVVWSGTGNTTLGVTDPANWVGNAVPTTGADVAFGLSAPATVNVPTSVTLGNITFNNTSPTARPDYTFSGQNAAKLTIASGAGITVNASGNVSGNGNVTLDSSLPVVLGSGTHTVNVSSGPTLTVAGNISQVFDTSGSLVKTGAGTLVLSGTNSYSGSTTLNAGTLKLGSSAALSSGTLIAAGGTVANGTGATLTLGNSVSVTGNTIFGATKSDSDLILNGSTSFANSTAYIGSFGRTTISGTVNTVNDTNNNFNFGGGDGTLIVTSDLASPAAGSAGLSVVSSTATSGEDDHLTVILRGNNTFTGNVSVTASSLILDSAHALPSGVAVRLSDDGYVGYTENSFGSFSAFKTAITTTNSTRTSDTIIGIDSANSGSPRTVSDTIDLSGLGSVYFGTASNATVSGSISNPNGGTLLLTGVNNGYLKITSPLTTAGNVTSVRVGNSESEPNDVTYKGYVELAGANNYTGGTTLKSGYLLVGNNSALGTGLLTVNGTADTGAPALAASAANVTLANDITLSVASGNSTTSDNKLVIGVPTTATATDFAFPLQSLASNNLTLTGNITTTGTNALSYVGSGTLTLSGNNTYSGGTTVSSGTLVANNSATSSATGSGTVTVASGATLQVGTGGTAGSVTGNIVNNGSVIYNRSDDATYAGVLSGTGSGTKLGAGTLTLSGANTFTGTIAINAGQLSISSDANLGASTAALALNNGVLVTPGSLTLNSARNITLGTLGTGNGFSPANATTLTFDGVISGGGGLTKYNGGTLSLGGANTFAGALTIGGGTVNLNNDTAAGAGKLTFSAASTHAVFSTSAPVIHGLESTSLAPGEVELSFATSPRLTINQNFDSTFYGTLRADHGSVTNTDGVFVKTGTGSLTLNGSFIAGHYGQGSTHDILEVQQGTLGLSNVSFEATTTAVKINGGTLSLASGTTLNNPVIVAMGSGTLTGNGAVNGPVTLDAGVIVAPSSGTLSIGGAIGGTGALTKSGAGTLTLSGANTFTGSTTVSAGTLKLGANNALPSATAVNLSASGATLDVSNNAVTVGSIAGVSGTTLALGSGSLATANNNSTTFAGAITGGTLTKGGTGTLTLSGANTYNGGTVINTGTLLLASTGSLAAGGDITLNNSGTFDVFANQTIRGLISTSAASNVVIESGATLTSNLPTINNTQSGGASGTATYAGAITGAGSFLKNGPGALTLTGTTSLTGLTTVSSGALKIGDGGTTGEITGNISTGNATIGNGTLEFNRSNPLIYSAVLSGNGTVVKNGNSTLTLSGSANAFNGNLTVNSGTLAFTGANTGSNLTASVASGALLDLQNSLSLASLSGVGATQIATGKTLTLSGVSTLTSPISGAGGVTFGNGITVAAPQTYTGLTTILTGGSLSLGNSTTSGSIAGNIVTNSNGSLVVNNPTPTTYAGIISGSGGVSLNGPGNLTLTGVNTYTGSTNINGGALLVGVDNAVPNGFVNVGANGTFLVGNNQTISSLGGNGTTSVAANKTLTLNNGGPLSSVISGSGNVAISGVVTVTSNQTYTGNTILNDTGNNLTLNLGNNTASGMVAGNIITTTAKTGVQFNRTDDVTYGGVISGGGFVNKNNTNTLTLTGQNTFTGNTNLSSGTLRVGAVNALPTATSVSFGNNTTLDVTANQTIAGFLSSASTSAIQIGSGSVLNITLGGALFGTSYNGTVSGAGALVVGPNTDPAGGHTVGLFGNNTYTGGTTIDPKGKLLLGNNGTTGSIVGNVTDNGVLIFNRGDKLIFSGVISGNGSVSQGVLTGGTTGDTVLTGNNTYTGGTNVYSKTLIIGDGGTTGSITGNVSLANNASLGFNRSDATSFAGSITGTGSLVKASTGNLTLTGQSNYSGTTTVMSGTLTVGTANALPITTQLALGASAVLDVEHNQTIAGFLTAGDLSSILHLDVGVTFTVAMPVANTTTTFAGTVNGDGTFAVSGAGGDVVNLTGTVASTVGTSVGTGATLNIASGGSLSGPIALGTGSILTLGNTGTQTFTNTISGAGSLLASAGTTTLSAPNTYTGGTVITGGKIIVSNTSGSATGTGPVVVGNGGILGGAGIITGTLVLNSGATVSPGNSPGLLTVGATTFASGATFAFDINNTAGVPGVNWDILAITGPLVISATTANPFVINLVSLDFGNNHGLLSNFNPAQPYSWQFVSTTGGITGFSAGAFQYNASQFQNSLNGGFFFVSQTGNNLFLNFSPVPEPSTWALLATGLGALGFIALRRRAKS